MKRKKFTAFLYFREPKMSIEEKRREIDGIDKAIVELLNQRAAVAKEISVIKMVAGFPIRDVRREDAVLRRLTGISEGLIDDQSLGRIYRTIFQESRHAQAVIREAMMLNQMPA